VPETQQSAGRRVWLGVALIGLVVGGCALGDRLVTGTPTARLDPGSTLHFFEAWLDAKYLVPPLKAPAGGSMTGMLDTETGVMTWRVTVARVTGAPTVAFHGPATKRENAGVALPIPALELMEDRGAYELSGRSTLTAAQIADLMAERWYVLATTSAHPDGETRGQIVRANPGVHGG